jgi:Flp pilus assembly pilin Flp
MKKNGATRHCSGATFLEYALLFATVATALIVVSIVVQRAVCGNWKQAGDVFGRGRIHTAPAIDN